MVEATGDLLRRSTAGDPAALRELVVRNLPGLRAFVRLRMSPLLRARESASDIVQSTCEDVLRELADFDWRGEEAFRGWLYTVVWNKLRNRERDVRAGRRDARREAPLDESEAVDRQLADCYAAVLTPTEHVIAEERARQLEAAFDELPDHYREVLTLSRIARLSRAEIAAHTGQSEASVRSTLTRALAALSVVLDRQERSAER